MNIFLSLFGICPSTSICGCGSGESGCSACGCCKACARELDGQEARQRGIFDAVKEMIPLDLLLGMPSDITYDFIFPLFFSVIHTIFTHHLSALLLFPFCSKPQRLINHSSFQ